MGFERDFAKWKREYFGHFCMTKCDKTCCDMLNVSLHVDGDELITIFGGNIKPEDYKELGIKPAGTKGFYSIESKSFCRQFDPEKRKCQIYDSRPVSCREYPFLMEKGTVIIKGGCSLNKGGPEYKKLTEIASMYGKVIVKRSGR